MIKRDFLDRALSDAVRAAWGMCAKCATPFERQKNGSWGQDFHCAHYFGRGSGNSTRWYPDNLVALCARCHKLLGNDPKQHARFIEHHVLGPESFERLEIRKGQVMKYTRAEKKDMAAHYRAETKRIMVLRDDGDAGYISLVSWD